MPRRAAAQIRPVEADPIHRSKLVQQVINKVMLDGKKSTAERIVYDALALLGERSRQRPDRDARGLDQGAHARRSRSNRAASAAPPTRCPSRSPRARARTLAVRWLVEFARQRREKTMAQRLANELLGRAVPAGRRVQAQGRHLPHGAGQQGLRALPLVERPLARTGRSSSAPRCVPLAAAARTVARRARYARSAR